MAVDGDFVIGKSGSRAVSFYTADDSAKALRFEEVRVNGQGPDENGTGFHIHASDEYRVAVRLSNPGPKGLTGVRVEFLLQNRLMDVSFIPSMAPGEIQGIQGVLTLDQALPQKFVIRAVEVDSKGGELLTSSEGTLLPSH
jgi:hypothetical protein